MAWDDVTSGGKTDFLSMEENKPVTVRFLEDEPHSVYEHSIEVWIEDEKKMAAFLEAGDDEVTAKAKALKKHFSSVLCPRDPKDPSSSCPMCDKNFAHMDAGGKRDNKPFPSRRRHYINVWNYSTNKVEVLSAGNELFKQIYGLYMMNQKSLQGIDVTIMRMGRGKDTSYSATVSARTPITEAQEKAVRFKLATVPRKLGFEQMQLVAGNPKLIATVTQRRITAGAETDEDDPVVDVIPPTPMPTPMPTPTPQPTPAPVTSVPAPQPTPAPATAPAAPTPTPPTPAPASTPAAKGDSLAKLRFHKNDSFASITQNDLQQLLIEIVLHEKLVDFDKFAEMAAKATATESLPAGKYVIGEYTHAELIKLAGLLC